VFFQVSSAPDTTLPEPQLPPFVVITASPPHVSSFGSQQSVQVACASATVVHFWFVRSDLAFIPAAQVFAETPPTKLSNISNAIVFAMRAYSDLPQFRKF
jgi:hypothetical protein